MLWYNDTVIITVATSVTTMVVCYLNSLSYRQIIPKKDFRAVKSNIFADIIDISRVLIAMYHTLSVKVKIMFKTNENVQKKKLHTTKLL